MEIDWSKAPEGATHYTHYRHAVQPWLKGTPENGFWWSNGAWQAFRLSDTVVPIMFEQSTPRHFAWNGEGLPPVGTVCMVYPHNTVWGFSSTSGHERTVLAYHGDFVWLGQGDMALETTRVDRVDFQPIRTPEQIAADEREKAVDDLCASIVSHYEAPKMSEHYLGLAKALHDAGYRKQA